MAVRLLPPGWQQLTSSGAIAAGAKLYTYDAGTSTPKATYSDSGLTIPNTNPVVADGSAVFGDVFADEGQYRVLMKTSADVTLWDADPIDGENFFGDLFTTNILIQKAAAGLAIDATSGGAFIEISATTGNTAYLDLQVPGADNSDIRVSTTGSGGRIETSGALELVPTTNVTVSNGNLAVSAGSLSDSKGNVRTIPQNAKTGAYVLVAGDVGKFVNITTGGVTVDTGIFSIGDVVWIYNNSGSSQTITQGGSVTLRLAGTATTGNRTLAQRGIMRVLCVAAGEFVTDGTGVT